MEMKIEINLGNFNHVCIVLHHSYYFLNCQSLEDLLRSDSEAMVNKCCVPGCTYNPDAPMCCFKFPSNEEKRKLWLSNIPRSDAFNTANSGVCVLHFRRKYVKYFNEHGEPMKRLRLSADAVPTKFNFEDFDSEVENEQEAETMDDIDLIEDFHNFKTEFWKHIDLKSWSAFCEDDLVTFFKLKRELSGNVLVEFSINIDSHMNIKIYQKFEEK